MAILLQSRAIITSAAQKAEAKADAPGTLLSAASPPARRQGDGHGLDSVDCGLRDWTVQSMHSHVAIRRQWGGPARCVPLLFVMLHAGCLRACRGQAGGGGWYAGRKAWQLGKAKLFSMHALKGAEPLCASLLSRKIFVRRRPPRNFIYSVWSLTLRLAKLFDKPLSRCLHKGHKGASHPSSSDSSNWPPPGPFPLEASANAITITPLFARHVANLPSCQVVFAQLEFRN